MQPSSNESAYLQIFRSVRPLFASDIPWAVEQGSKDDISARSDIKFYGALMKVCMGEFPAYTQQEHFATLDTFALFIAHDLQQFLFILQDLIDDKIKDEIVISASNDIDERFLKLKILDQKLQSLTSGEFNAQDYFCFLRVHQNPANLKKVVEGVMKLNDRLTTEMSKRGPDATYVPKTRTDTTSTTSTSWLETNFNPSFWSSSHRLFRALVHNLSQCKFPRHSAMLKLKGMQHPKPQDHDAEFNILLSFCPKQDLWQETLCHVRYQNPTASELESLDITPFENVCETVQMAKNYEQLPHIFVYEGGLWVECHDYEPLYPKAAPTMTLAKLIDCGSLKGLRDFQLKDRWILALTLAKSLLQLHNGPWLQTLWTSENLFFYVRRSQQGVLPKAACIEMYLEKYPLLLSFGQFLLELAIGEKLPATKTGDGVPSQYLTLKKNFNKLKGSLSTYYAQAIEGCLKFHLWLKHEEGSDEDIRIRSAIFKRIIEPLEKNLQIFINNPTPVEGRKSMTSSSGLSSRSPSHRDLYLDLPEILEDKSPRQLLGTLPYRDVEISLPPAVENLGSDNSQLTGVSCYNSNAPCASALADDKCRIETVTPAENIQLWSQGMEEKNIDRKVSVSITTKSAQLDCTQIQDDASMGTEPDSGGQRGVLLGAFDTKKPDTQEYTSPQWPDTFKELFQLYSRQFQEMDSDKPVKVAILDTGIDLLHPDFQRPRSNFKQRGINPVDRELNQIDRIRGWKNFCNDRSDIQDVADIDGHGTHVAGIILQLAPRAELYIARVCEGDENYGRTAQNQAINMSNSKRKQSAQMKKVDPSRVEKVLKKARENSIAVFAAASNSGNHGPAAWPARDFERAICVHSSNDYGTKSSDFTPEAYSETINFMAIGENVCSHWPTSKGGGFRKMSGTSTATAVATAIAALLLAFTQQSICEKKKKEVEKEMGLGIRELPRMRALLKCICKVVGEYYWIQPQLLWADYSPTEKQRDDPTAAINYAWSKIREALRK
ncbi:hypothetical protein B7463_g12582, partial [Scytalidium lignicola]